MNRERAIVIGAGSTGCAIAHDLSLRGLQVTVVERGGVASGTTGHNQAQLHSGGRYVVNDPEAAGECIRENLILRRILPGILELNGGLFVAVSDQGMAYRKPFLEACAACGIPATQIPTSQALQLEPRLNPALLAAIQVPDGVFDPYRLCLSFLASACQNGAVLRTFCEVTSIDAAQGSLSILDRRTGKSELLHADAIINAAGPWASEVAKMAGAEVELEASAGLMVNLAARLCSRVINLLAPAGDGDIIVPQRQSSILGTTSWSVGDPDDIPILPEHIELVYTVAEKMFPDVRQVLPRGVMAAARPLRVVQGSSGRATTRGFACLDHAATGQPGFFSVIGGKTTTARLMAEKLADLVCTRLGIQAACRTAELPLLSYRRWVQP